MTGVTLYEQIGGKPAVEAAVDQFYVRVLADPTLSHFFTGVNLGRLKSHQFAFLSQALGGPKQYTGASMQEAHARLAIQQSHFTRVAEHLVATLRDLGVSEAIIAQVAAAVTPLSAEVVNTPTPPVGQLAHA